MPDASRPQVAPRSDRRPGTARRRLGHVVLAVVVGVVALQALAAVARVRTIETRREHELALPGSVTERVVAKAGRWAPGIDRARMLVRAEGGRFAVVFGPGVPESERDAVRLVAGATFLPATGTANPRVADVLVTVGGVDPDVRTPFRRVFDDGLVWIGRRET